MATIRRSIINGSLTPDPTDVGGVYWDLIANQLTLANAVRGYPACIVMEEPNGNGDAGVAGLFVVPASYSSNPVLRITGILNGSPANTLAFGVTMGPVADNEAFDAAHDSEDTASASLSGYSDEDVYVETISLSNTFAAGDLVSFFFYWDDSVASPWTGTFLLTDLEFQWDT